MPSIRPVLQIVRDDGRVVGSKSYDNLWNEFIPLLLEEIPDLRYRTYRKWLKKSYLSEEEMDEMLMQAVMRAAHKYRYQLNAVGLDPSTWMR